jgi:RimJ/RimL family protein N-acetyltransferase
VTIPVLETPRLRLRSHQLDDFAACAAMWADANVTRYIGGRPFSTEESWTRFLRYAGSWALMGFGFWALEEKATGTFLGELGFMDFRREMTPSFGDAPEAGWVMTTESHGKGYATEALRAAVAWSDESLQAPRTVCMIHPENPRSIRVAEKCGYREERVADYKGNPVIVFARSMRT